MKSSSDVMPAAVSEATTADSAQWSRLASPDLTMCLVVLIWGGNFAAVKLTIQDLGALPFLAVRFGVAAILLLVLLRWREGDCRFPTGSFWPFLGFGVIGNTVYQLLFTTGLVHTTSANSAAILTTTPVVVALAGGLLGTEKIRRTTWFGLALAMGGIATVMSARGLALSAQTMTGDLLVLSSVFCWTAYVLGIRAWAGRSSALRTTALTTLTGTPGLVLLGLPGLWRIDWFQVRGVAYAGIVYSSVLALVVCYLLYNRNVKLIGGVRTTIYGCAIPLVATLIAWPVLGERPVWWQAIGALLIIAGVLVTRR